MLDFLLPLHDYIFWGNSTYTYLIALVWLVGLLLVLKIVQLVVLGGLASMARRTRTEIDDLLIKVVKNVRPPFYLVVALYFSLQQVALADLGGQVAKVILLFIVIWEVIRALELVIEYGVDYYMQKLERDGGELYSRSMIRSLKVIFKVILWLLGILMILSNLGVNVSSVLAGLGVGGLAVALALQGVLSDVFSSFSIYIDKPFRVGDFIEVGSDSGTVEKIGLKTSRLKTVRGEELVIANKELTGARVKNLKRMEVRQTSVTIGVTYETPQDKLDQIPALVKEVVDSVDAATFLRCHFTNLGSYSLDFTLAYEVSYQDYTYYLDAVQAVNYGLFKRFAAEGISFAYPTAVSYEIKM